MMKSRHKVVSNNFLYISFMFQYYDGGTFSIRCSSDQITRPATAKSNNSLTSIISQITTGTTELSSNATPFSPIYSSAEDKESLIGPLVGGVSGFVVLIAVTTIVIYCLRRKQKVKKDKITHSDNSSNDQINGDNINMTENLASVNSVADDRAISLIDVSYDSVKVDRDAGNQRDKKTVAFKQTHTENNYHYASDKEYKTDDPHSSGETITRKEDFALYTAVNKPSKMQTHITQNKENLAIYSAVNKSPTIQPYTTKDNVYDRTDSDKTVRKMEDYHRLGAVQAIGIATEDTYESAPTTGRNELLSQNDYDILHGIL